MVRRRIFTFALAVGAMLTATGARHRAVTPHVPPPIDTMRSLVIVDPAMLDGFTFERVLQTLIDRSGATSTTPLSLYRQWFDTQNPKPGLAMANAPHCDDFITDGKPSFNGFQRRCPTPEGIFATTDPFAANDYAPIGITNRFDLTPADGSNCGQYRIVFAKMTVKPQEKLHIIFEPVLPNPNPSAGAAGCRPVAQFWANLSSIDSIAERRARIEQFFFDGIDGFPPVLRPEHFSREAGGRIRTSQKAGGLLPRFYQFHLVADGARLLVTPGLLENETYAPLFNAAAITARGDEFRKFFISQVATLVKSDPNAFFNAIPDKYLVVENDSQDDIAAADSRISFAQGSSTPSGRAFIDAIAAEARRVGASPLFASPFFIVDRSWQMSCSGCHDISPGFVVIGAPISLGVAGTHIDEQRETVNGVTRFKISDALRFSFAPNRAKILTDFLAGKPMPIHSNDRRVSD